VAGSTRDITERKRVEEELRASRNQLRVLTETLEEQVRIRTTELEERNSEMLMQSDRLRELSVRLMETQDNERRHIARELHDSAGQLIAALAMNLGRMQKELASVNSEMAQLAEETRSYAEELNREIRTTSYLLHPPLLDEIGLPGALGWLVEGLKQRADLQVRLEIQDGFERPSRDVELAIFRVVQECLTNIHRHSGSKSAAIEIFRDGRQIVVEVADSGVGISAERLAKIRSNGLGVGLRGIRERVRPFAGEVRIESQEGIGTTVVVTFPLAEEAAAAGPPA
jgi:signal transduction histidine kinase